MSNLKKAEEIKARKRIQCIGKDWCRNSAWRDGYCKVHHPETKAKWMRDKIFNLKNDSK